MIKIDLSGINIPAAHIDQKEIDEKIASHSMGGWVDLPVSVTREEIARIAEAGGRIKESSAVVVIGAGGSSLGARALIEAFGGSAPAFFWCGDNLSGAHLSGIISRLASYKSVSVIAASKSGTTLETLIALRAMFRYLVSRYGGAAHERLYIITENRKTPIRDFAESVHAGLFDIPLNVGGRYSVLTPAGLLPAAAAGIDISKLLEGAAGERADGGSAAAQFAAARIALYDSGYTNEILAVFEPAAAYIGAWWRQLFGESEGKEGGGIFPSSVSFTGDLHSMGQYIQEGRRNIFETALLFDELHSDVKVSGGLFADGLDFLTSQSLNEINKKASKAVLEAHQEGGVPIAAIHVPTFDEAGIGAAIYFFEKTVAYSGYLKNIDPFDQPGVEAYKKRVKKALGI